MSLRGTSSVASSVGKLAPPDFTDLSRTKTRRLLQGRHPRSFPRDSEFWWRYRLSDRRLNRIQKGRSLQEVLQGENEGMAASSLSLAEHDGQLEEDDQQPMFSLLSRETHSWRGAIASQQAMLLAASESHLVDAKKKVKVHYNMNFVLLNFLGECLCVNDLDEVCCKRLADLAAGEKYIFRVMDFNEPSNAGRVAFDDAIWLMPVSDASDSAWELGSALVSRLFHAPRMTSLQAKGSNVSGDEDDEEGGGSSAVKQPALEGATAEGSSSAGFKGDVTPRRRAMKAVSLLGRDVSGGRRGGRRSVGAAVGSGEDEELLAAQANALSKKEVDRRRQHKEAETAICGALGTTRMVLRSEADDKPGASKYKSRQAKHLGQYAVRSALRPSDRVDPDNFCTLDPVYLEQDLYCVATTHGSVMTPWPPKSSNVENPVADPRTFGCLRRVAVRSYADTLVDRKCMWRFCALRSNSDSEAASLLMVSDQKVFNSALDSLDKSASLRHGARRYAVQSRRSDLPQELYGGQKFARNIRLLTAMETLQGETRQMRRVRANEESARSHFGSIDAQIRDWRWTGGSIRENSLHVRSQGEHDCPQKQRYVEHRATVIEDDGAQRRGMHSSGAAAIAKNPSARIRPVRSMESRFSAAGGSGQEWSVGPLTEGDDIALIRRNMLAISNKNANLYALTEVGAGGGAAASPSSKADAAGSYLDVKERVLRRHLQLLRDGDELVAQAIRHMERERKI